jgi:hypothetical protein
MSGGIDSPTSNAAPPPSLQAKKVKHNQSIKTDGHQRHARMRQPQKTTRRCGESKVKPRHRGIEVKKKDVSAEVKVCFEVRGAEL